MSEIKTAKINDVVIYTTPTGIDCNALVTEVWGHSAACLNLVYTSPNEKERDDYGRQTKRESSVSHASVSGVHGRNWRWPDEAKPEYKAPLNA